MIIKDGLFIRLGVVGGSGLRRRGSEQGVADKLGYGIEYYLEGGGETASTGGQSIAARGRSPILGKYK